MADNRSMEEMLQAPTEGYGNDIVVPDILAKNFEIKTSLLSLIQANQFYGFESNNPHDHIRSFNRITLTLKFRDVSNELLSLCFSHIRSREPLKFVAFKVSTTSSRNSSSTDARIDKPTDKISNLVETFNKKMTTPTTMKEVEETCVICGGVHPYYDCIATNSNILIVCATTATTPVNENCSAVILKKLPEKLRDPGKFLIPCDFPEFDECLALEDLGASFNLMPLSIWRKLSLPELTYTQMILELADRSTTRPAGIPEDVFVKVGKFYFLTDFVVVDYVIDPCVPLILRRPFLRAGRALIDVYGEELTLRVDDEAITFNVGQTSKYSYNNAESINQIDVIDVACEEYVQEVLGFSDKSKSGSPAPTSDPIISFSSPSFTPFEGSDFIMEEIKTFLQTPDELSNLDDDY
nr:reverse transcriptase domain-containing protein [Tanacetum cinerariifolium]